MSERADLRQSGPPVPGMERPWIAEPLRRIGPPLQRVGGDLLLAILAIVLSVILWFIVTNEQNPPVEGLYPYEVNVRAVNVRNGLDVFGDIGTVRIRISAPRDVWGRLRVDTFDAKVDLSQAEAGRREVPVRVESRDPQVTVLEVSPSQLSVWLEPREQREVPVRVEIRDGPPEGYSYRPAQTSIAKVTVSGPASLVQQVESAVAQVSVEGARVTINQQVPLVARSFQGRPISNVRIDPSVVTVEVPIDQQVQYKAVPVHPVVRGDVYEGYWVESIQSEPPIVVLMGTRDALQPVTFAQTAPVAIDNERQTVSRPVPLELPEGVSVATEPTVTVQVRIAPTVSSKTIQVTPIVRGLDPSLTYTVGEVAVTLQGPSPTLAPVAPSDLTATVDATDLGPGTYELPVAVAAPSGIQVQRLVPERVRVEVREA